MDMINVVVVVVNLRRFGFGVESGEFFNVELSISVFIESLQKKNDFRCGKIERMSLKDGRCLFQADIAISIDVVLLEFRNQLHFPKSATSN